MKKLILWLGCAGGLLVAAWTSVHSQSPPAGLPRGLSVAEKQARDAPFKGVTTDGTVVPNLFPIRATGVSTEPVTKAAEAFLTGLSEEQRQKAVFAVTAREWRYWDNRHFAPRHGVGFQEMTGPQRTLAFELLGASLSAKGLKKSQDIMKLNGTLAELTNNFQEYGEWLYSISIMGNPSATEPWGWQLDGHHVNVNYFVLGDQVVMSPVFMGSEPIRAEGGRFKGTVVLQDEQNMGLALMNALDAAQCAQALVRSDKGPTNTLTEAYKDNLVLDYAGIAASAFDAAQKKRLLDLIAEFVGNLDEGHARVSMEEVRKHLDQTHFAWIGETKADGVFYYRIHSPVILIEFDHQRPIALARSLVPTRNHIHTVVRTPNGNDYGKDLLRQHHESTKHGQ